MLSSLYARAAIVAVAACASLSGVVRAEFSAAGAPISAGALDRAVLTASRAIATSGPGVERAFVPDDPYYFPGNPAGSPGQWHLNNTFNPINDINVTPAWSRGLTGAGVVIGIVDDSLETAHPDLAPNYSAVNSFNFGSYTGAGAPNDPNPYRSNDQHGVSVAGLVAARGGNTIGVTGVAPHASLAGLRVDFQTQTSAMFANAITYRPGFIHIKNHSYGEPDPFYAYPLEHAAVETSAADGTINVFAAGNYRYTKGQDSGKSNLINGSGAIVVSATAFNGVVSSYSNFGANVFVTAPSNGNTYGIVTTDRTGVAGYGGFADQSYTNGFGGTSAATPIVSGALALAKQANPNLDTRFAKHLLARTSRVVDANDMSIEGDGNGVTAGSAWRTNGAGLKFNQNYGFGMVDVDALTQAATQYTGVTAAISAAGGFDFTAALPDGSGLYLPFVVSNFDTPVEDVIFTMHFSHQRRGDLAAIIVSPSGTASRLFSEVVHPTLGDNVSVTNYSWDFLSNAFWGEDPNGEWRVYLFDTYVGTTVATGTWQGLDIVMNFGELIPIPEPGSLLLLTSGALLLLCRRRAV